MKGGENTTIQAQVEMNKNIQRSEKGKPDVWETKWFSGKVDTLYIRPIYQGIHIMDRHKHSKHFI